MWVHVRMCVFCVFGASFAISLKFGQHFQWFAAVVCSNGSRENILNNFGKMEKGNRFKKGGKK